MTEISPRRRVAGRWALVAGAALTLPLTATVVYAGQDAPEPPAPAAAPDTSPAPGTRTVERKVVVISEHRDHAKGKHSKPLYEKKLEKDGNTVIIRSDQPISEAELEEKLARVDEVRVDVDELAPRAPGESREVRKIIMRDSPAPEGRVFAVAVSKCHSGPMLADIDAGSEGRTASGGKTVSRTRILMCGDPGETSAQALAQLRRARDEMADNEQMTAEIRAQVLEKLDDAIARIEREKP